MARWGRDGNDAATLAIFDGFGSLGVSEVSGFAAERQIFGTFFWHIFGCVAYEKTPKPWYSNVPGFSIPVRAGGVEPPRAYTHCHLKTARLPFRHARRQSINLHQNPRNLKSACRDGYGVRFTRIGQSGAFG